MNFLASGPGRSVVSRMKRNEVDVWVSVEFVLLSSLLAMSPGFVLAAATRDGLQEKGATATGTRSGDSQKDDWKTIRGSRQTHKQISQLVGYTATESCPNHNGIEPELPPPKAGCFIATFGYRRPPRHARTSRVLEVGSHWHGCKCS